VFFFGGLVGTDADRLGYTVGHFVRLSYG
jgi:hypothetical protein